MNVEYTCYTELKALGKGVIPTVHGEELGTFQLAIMAGHVDSEVFPPQTRYIVVTAEEACRIAIGEDVEARNEAPLTRRIYDGKEYVFRVGEGDILSVIQAAP